MFVASGPVFLLLLYYLFWLQKLKMIFNLAFVY